MWNHYIIKPWRIGIYSTILAAISTVALGAVLSVDVPPSRITLCPDTYLIEFTSEPGSPEAATVSSTFLNNLSTLKTVEIRQKLDLLLHGVSLHVKDPMELSIIMGWDSIKRVTQLTIVSPPKQAQPTQNDLVTSSLAITGVSKVHSELGVKGRGIKVAVIDTGVDYTHPALGGCFGKGCRVITGHDFVGDKYNGSNSLIPKKDPMDCKGHGTHVAGIIGASNGIVTGVAPEVELGAYKIMGCDGDTNDDIIVAALERAIKDGMDVINISLGETGGWTNNPIARAISKIKDFGVMVAVAHGNDNLMGLFSSNYLGVDKSVLAVASVMNSKVIALYLSTSLDPTSKIFYNTGQDTKLNGTFPIVAALNGTDLSLGCDPYNGDLTGKILLVLRGSCTFELKGQHAQDKGALGIIFANNVAGTPTIPVMGNLTIIGPTISQGSGQTLFEMLKNNSNGVGEFTTGDATVTFNPNGEVIPNPAGGAVSSFSSFGLNNDLSIKPDIAAPGENIFSTWIMKKGAYSTISGTSMATPHVAGSLALALQQYRRFTGSNSRIKWQVVERIFNIIHNTADPIHVFMNHTPFDYFSPPETSTSDADAAIESIAKQGSGQINVYRLVTNLKSLFSKDKNNESTSPIRSTLVMPAVLAINDTDYPSYQNQTLTIYNYGDKSVQYKLSYLSAETLHEISIEQQQIRLNNSDLYHPGQNNSSGDDILYVKADPEVLFSSDTVSVPANGKRKVSVTILPPQELSDDEHWVYSGFIVIMAASAPDSLLSEVISLGDPSYSPDAIHVPFAGVKGSMKTLPIFLEPTPDEIAVNKDLDSCGTLKLSKPLAPGQTDPSFSFDGKDFPTVLFCIKNPTELLLMDLVTGTPINSSSTDPSVPEFLSLGRIASSKYVARSPPGKMVTAAEWDGTIEFNVTNKLGPDSERELIQKVPSIDILFGMQPKTPNVERVESSRSSSNNEQMIPLVQRDVDDAKPEQGIYSDLPTDGDPNNDAVLSTQPHKGETRFKVPDGYYRLRLRALRMLGDINNPEDYDEWMSPAFSITRIN